MSRVERLALAAALVVWAAVGVGRSWGWWGMLIALLLLLSPQRWLVAVAIAGVLSGAASTSREGATLDAALPAGKAQIAGRVVDDPTPYGPDFRFRLQPSHIQTESGWDSWRGPRLAVLTDQAVEVAAGDIVATSGRITNRPGFIRGDPVAGVLENAEVTRLEGPGDPLFRTGNAVRQRVEAVFGERGPPGALLTGFLVGDTSGMSPEDLEALRRAGLAHFVAVSGSNVALFLAAWFLAAGPLGWRPMRRAVVGSAGLALFLIITRWEPSVVRASIMAELLLVGRASGLAITPWAALGGAVALVLLVSPQLGGQVGFQLSVAATSGVLIAGRLNLRGWVRRALAITLGAQLAVAPLLLWHFEAMPLLAPLTNLVAAPLVTAATVFGAAAGLIPHGALLFVADACAGLVLELSRAVAGGPQLGWLGVAGAVGLGLLWRLASIRPLLVVGAAAGLVLTLLPPAHVTAPTAVFLDVGQGDATLLLGPAGESILIDGGREPALVLAKLRRRGIDRLGLLVATHGDEDHIGGLPAVLRSMEVGVLWHPDHREGSELYRDMLATAAQHGIEDQVPRPGWEVAIGGWHLKVLGPARRYASLNDESIVVLAEAEGREVLLTGDIEHVAQGELGDVVADVLKVPHHGAATTDLDWLRRSAAPVSVVSVGQNDFGHPAPGVLATLEEAGSVVRRTDLEGDVVIRLARSQ